MLSIKEIADYIWVLVKNAGLTHILVGMSIYAFKEFLIFHFPFLEEQINDLADSLHELYRIVRKKALA